ncbi:MAG: 1-acyl-sn-glycerol-3-phosphate acyltransferase [Bacteroidaceae bacterium]|nr:1-acyl-sn-glycerol-3-phosphate acyltransferase [Bacteroidaceae bacterium]MBR6857723.1 1-acyl-sn-glycerol-3-phosphate acyltransferase [Bacteroidaceae bacterium]
MADFFLRIYDRLKCRKGLAALIVVLIIALCTLSLCRLHYEEDIAGFLPIDRSDSRQTEFMETVSQQNSIAVIFRAPEGTPDEDIISAMDLFADLWFESDTLEMVPDMSAEADESVALELIKFVQEHYPSFLTPEHYRRMDSLLSQPGYVKQSLEADKRSLQMLTGSFTASTIPYDPLGLFGDVLMGLADIGSDGGYRLVDGHILHRTEPAGLLLFESPFGESESGRNAQLVELTDKTGAQVEAETGIKVSSVGAPVIAVTNADRIKKDSILAVGLAVIGILAVLWFSFKRLDYILWIAATLLFGALFSLGLIGCIKDSVSVIVIGMGSVIVGIAANYPLHFLHSLRDTADNRESLAQMVVPLLVGNVTTVSAFLCLLFLKAQAMHDLALFGSFMLAGTIIFSLIFLPVFAKAGTKAVKEEVKVDSKPVTGSSLLCRIVSPTVILITIAMLIWGGSSKFDTDLNHINYMTAQQKEDLQFISGSVGDAGADRLSVLAAKLAPEDQKEAVAERWTKFWHNHPQVIEELREEARKQGFTESAFAPFLESVSGEPDIVSAQDVTPVNMSEVMASLVKSLSDDFNTVLFLCGFIVFAFLWISFRNLELALISFLPLTVGWIWILSIMNMLGIQFNIVSIILATFIFGQGDDYTIFITEGLLREYKTGVRTVDERRKSVIISAILMFIGIGTLIFARHPAMRSLAEITILGMFVVVVMAHFLPEWLFRWMTMKNGKNRVMPVSIMRILRSAWAFGFLLLSVIVCTPVVLVIFIGRKREWKDRFLHNLLYRFANLVIRRVPAVKFTLDNSIGETFSKPAVIISNHQSHLDLMCLMMLTPKMIVVTNDWVWRNPIYGALIRRAEFVPAAEGIEEYMPQFRSLVERGYSILVFPEGTRSADCSILRFHKGAFHLAQELGLDILPVCLNGVGYALPKEEFMLRPGHITVTVGKRVAPDDLSWGADARERTKAFHKFYQEWYAQMCNKLES